MSDELGRDAGSVSALQRNQRQIGTHHKRPSLSLLFNYLKPNLADIDSVNFKFRNHKKLNFTISALIDIETG